MLQLLKVEWMKLKHYRTFWVLFLLYLISITGSNYIVYEVLKLAPKDEMVKSVMGKTYTFPEVWHMASYVASFLMFMPGLLMIISVTNEFSYKTHRQNIIDGWSRMQFISVKIVLAVLLSFISTLVVFLTALAFGFITGTDPLSFEKFDFIGFFFIQVLSYTSLALLFSVLLKRSGIAIGLFFLYMLFLENILVQVLNRYVNNLGRYLPLESTDNLIRTPVFKAIVNQVQESYNTPVLLLMSAIYLGLYYFISIKKFTTDDL